MNYYIIHITSSITYDIFINLVTIYQENESQISWKTKLLFSIHLCDLITRDISYIQQLNIETRNFIVNILIDMSEYSEKYVRKVANIFQNIIDNNIEISEVGLIECYIENL